MSSYAYAYFWSRSSELTEPAARKAGLEQLLTRGKLQAKKEPGLGDPGSASEFSPR